MTNGLILDKMLKEFRLKYLAIEYIDVKNFLLKVWSNKNIQNQLTVFQ